MKKFFYLCFSVIFLVFSTFSLSGCKKNEVEKVSKNLTSYAIDAELGDDMKIFANEKIVYHNNTGKELGFLCLHLYARAFREGAMIKPYTTLTEASCFPKGVSYGDIIIRSVNVDGKSKKVELVGEDEDILKVDFGKKLAPKKTIEVMIEFELAIPNSTHRLGWFESNVNLGNWYPIVCNYENGKFDTTPYYSTGDPFVSDIANYDVNFKYPSRFKLCSTGEIKSTKNSKKIESKIQAKAVRDFAMCLSSNATIKSGVANNTTVFYMGYAGDKNIEKYLEIAKKAVEYFSEIFGGYPYSTLTVAKSSFIYGGMEYPNMVIVSDSIDDEDEMLKVIVHEIAHQWWYGVVGNNQIKEAWLDESLAEYSTALFFKNNKKYGITYDDFVGTALSSYMLYVDVIETIRGDVNTKMNLPVYKYQNDYEYSYMVYVKGVIMFDSLSQMVGEKKVVQGLKKYYAENKFKFATKQDFFDAFKSACHKDLETFFNGYLNGSVVISAIN